MTKEEKVIYLDKWIKAGIKASQKANPSSIEKTVWRELDKLGINYEIQKWIGKWIVDIFIPERNLVIECNGDYYHNYKIFPEKKIRDNNLQEYCDKNNIRLLWLWEKEIKNGYEEKLLERILTEEEYEKIIC